MWTDLLLCFHLISDSIYSGKDDHSPVPDSKELPKSQNCTWASASEKAAVDLRDYFLSWKKAPQKWCRQKSVTLSDPGKSIHRSIFLYPKKNWTWSLALCQSLVSSMGQLTVLHSSWATLSECIFSIKTCLWFSSWLEQTENAFGLHLC